MDGHIDMKKLTVAFCKFANAPKNYKKIKIMRKIRVDRAITITLQFIYSGWGGGRG